MENDPDKVLTAYHCQIVALDLMPWQSPPGYVDPPALSESFGDERRAREDAELLLRMQRCGVSRWRPDPVAACDAAQAKRRTPAK